MKTYHFEKILIIATRQIGDTLITTPLIEKTHSIWPKAKIDFLGFNQAVDILKGNPYLNEVIGTSKKPSKKFMEIFYVQNFLFGGELAIFQACLIKYIKEYKILKIFNLN